MKHLISPSFLSANFGQLNMDIEMVNASQADWFHLDIMDGVFVPNISFGMPIIKQIKSKATKPLDVHLMIVDPDRYITAFKDAGADILTVHYEACTHLHRTIQVIKSLGMKAGVALNPHTPVSVLEEIIGELDMVLIMSVNPGFGGQRFIETSYSKIRKLKELVVSQQSNTIIQVDGGVNNTNAAKLLDAGTNCLVAGNFVFKSEDPTKTIEWLKIL
ncbi:MAG: ribulose-phosphate 3-epimerase [Bacteroidales bacterium]|nr:ribulose-phosphate 3-epimerase [Bacteroidales bacterium]MCF8456623.1 ribulose-phosphate 3-epimerase [Bacteroidales bacterium]